MDRSSYINKFFNRVYVITCNNLIDRQIYIKNHFAEKNINFEFYVSVDKNQIIGNKISNSEKSLAISHLNCVINAKLNNYKNILICEDDVNFVENVDEKFNNFINDVPDDWNFLQLGNQFWANHWLKRQYIKNNLYKFLWGTGSHCIAINQNSYEIAINSFQKYNTPIDFMYYDLFSKLNCYCPENFIADSLSKNDHLGRNDERCIFDSLIHHKYYEDNIKII